MKMAVTYEKHDVNSTEKRELVMFGEPVGCYTYGTYCRYQQFLCNTANSFISNIKAYVKRALVNTLEIDINSREELLKASEMIEEDSIGEWFENYMKKEMQGKNDKTGRAEN